MKLVAWFLVLLLWSTIPSFLILALVATAFGPIGLLLAGTCLGMACVVAYFAWDAWNRIGNL